MIKTGQYGLFDATNRGETALLSSGNTTYRSKDDPFSPIRLQKPMFDAVSTDRRKPSDVGF